MDTTYPELIGPGLRGRIDRSAGGVTLALSGELDVASADGLARRVSGTDLMAGRDRLVLDLGGVGFLDSAGIIVLLESQRHLAGRGVDLVATCARGPVMRTLAITGLMRRASGSSGAPDAA